MLASLHRQRHYSLRLPRVIKHHLKMPRLPAPAAQGRACPAPVLQEHGGIAARHYHAGMTPKQRMGVQNAWRSGRHQVVVATIAFGEPQLLSERVRAACRDLD